MLCGLTSRDGTGTHGLATCVKTVTDTKEKITPLDLTAKTTGYDSADISWEWKAWYCKWEGDYRTTVTYTYHGEKKLKGAWSDDRLDKKFGDTPIKDNDDLTNGVGLSHPGQIKEDHLLYSVNWDDWWDTNAKPNDDREPSRYCRAECFDDVSKYDVGIGWEQGGDVSRCCGDDANEWLLDCYSKEKSSSKKACGSNQDHNRACCDLPDDCVANNLCYANTWEGDVDDDGAYEYCKEGAWYELPKVTAKVYIKSPKDRIDGTYFDNDEDLSDGDEADCSIMMDCGVTAGTTSCSYAYDSDTIVCTYYSVAKNFKDVACTATCTYKYNGCETGGTYEGNVDFMFEAFDGNKNIEIKSSYENAKETDKEYYYFCGYKTTSALTFKRPGATVFTDQDMLCGLTSRYGTETHGLTTCAKTVTDTSVDITPLALTASTTKYDGAEISWVWDSWYCKWEGKYTATVTFKYNGEKKQESAWSDDRKDKMFDDTPIKNNDDLTNGKDDKKGTLSFPGYKMIDYELYSVNWDDKQEKNFHPGTRKDSPSVYCSLECFDDKTDPKDYTNDFGIGWARGGDATDGKTACCGDDANEFFLGYDTTDPDGPYTNDNVKTLVGEIEEGKDHDWDACCDDKRDCVYKNMCYSHGTTVCMADGNQQDIRKCDNNVWKTIQTCADGYRCTSDTVLEFQDWSCRMAITDPSQAAAECYIKTSTPTVCRDDAADCAPDEVESDGSCKEQVEDDGDDTIHAGVCTDYLGCKDNVCAKRVYRDTCRTEGGTWVFEYLRSGATCIGHWVDCEGHEYTKCATELIDENPELYRDGDDPLNTYNAFGINYECAYEKDAETGKSTGRGFCSDQERLPLTLTNYTCDPFVCNKDEHRCTDFCTKAKHCAGGNAGRSICIQGDEDPNKGVCGFSCRPIDNTKWYQKWNPDHSNADPATGEYRGHCCNEIKISGNLWGTFYIEMFREPPPIIISNTTMDMIVYSFPDHIKVAETTPRVYPDGSFTTAFTKAGGIDSACFDVGQFFLEIVLPDYEVSTTKLLTVSTKEDGQSIKVQIGDLALPTGA